MNLTVDEYRSLIASRAMDIADIAENTARGFDANQLGAVLPEAINRLHELVEGYDEAVARDVSVKALGNKT